MAQFELNKAQTLDQLEKVHTYLMVMFETADNDGESKTLLRYAKAVRVASERLRLSA